jgi:energy-coupling factor transporter ATP-binding protein EcfA2
MDSFPQFNMVFQNPDTQLFNPTVREEIIYKLPGYNQELYAWLIDALDLKRYEETQPLLLSEGEKRRVALAIAIMHPHKHGILLDEPSLGQDRVHKEFLVRLLREMVKAGWFILFATHDLELASHADRLILLTGQGIVRDGASNEVLTDRQAWDKAGLLLPDWVSQ